MEEEERIKKNIIALCDGTWNKPTIGTNVYRLSKVLYDNGHSSFIYKTGVGTGESKVKDGILAKELDNKIKDIYTGIVQKYNDENNKFKRKKIWLFGFSRGAYIVRCVAGMIYNCGILKYDNEELIHRAYEIYRNRNPNYDPKGQESQKFKDSFSHPNPTIKFLGLWDTVGAHGIPTYTIGKGFEYLKFYNQNVSEIVKNAYQALSSHEDLSLLEPCRIFKSSEYTNLEEIWFPGRHIDVGGGILSDNKGVSDESLLWMIDKIVDTENSILRSDLLNLEKLPTFPKEEEQNLLSNLPLIKKNPPQQFITDIYNSTFLDLIKREDLPKFINEFHPNFFHLDRKRVIPLYRDTNGMLTFDLLYKKGDWDFANKKYDKYSTSLYKEMEGILIQELIGKGDKSASSAKKAEYQKYNIGEISKYFQRNIQSNKVTNMDTDDKIAKKIKFLFNNEVIGKERINNIKSFDVSTISKFDIPIIISKISALLKNVKYCI